MKAIYLVRHAKSSWEDSSLKDRERPLNNRGLRDAPFMAKLLLGKGVQADRILSSPAIRAFSTASYFAEVMNIPKSEIQVKNKIYEAFPQDVLDIIADLEEDCENVLIFGHNPTFTSLANRFSDDYLPNVPTCGIVKLKAETDHWSQFVKAGPKLTKFYYPKQYF